MLCYKNTFIVSILCQNEIWHKNELLLCIWSNALSLIALMVYFVEKIIPSFSTIVRLLIFGLAKLRNRGVLRILKRGGGGAKPDHLLPFSRASKSNKSLTFIMNYNLLPHNLEKT